MRRAPPTPAKRVVPVAARKNRPSPDRRGAATIGTRAAEAHPRRRALRRLAWFALALMLLPTAVIALYRVVPPPITPLMLARVVEGDGLRRDWVPLDAISPHLPAAVIAGEDNLFCEHHGFDWPALRREIEAALSGERARGASTITQQTAKNILLWPERDVLRKAVEAALTPQIELLWPKRRIMEVYLNIAEMGRGVFGAEAAARAYFDRPASELSRTQAALLAAVLPNPREWSAARPGRYVRARAATLVRRTDQLGPLLDCVR